MRRKQRRIAKRFRELDDDGDGLGPGEVARIIGLAFSHTLGQEAELRSPVIASPLEAPTGSTGGQRVSGRGGAATGGRQRPLAHLRVLSAMCVRGATPRCTWVARALAALGQRVALAASRPAGGQVGGRVGMRPNRS